MPPLQPLHRLREEVPFVNRIRERGLLLEHLNSARSGKGGMVLLEGEAGVGKSRLVTETIGEALGKGFHSMSGRCLDYRKIPYFPFIEMLKDHFRVLPGRSRKENRGSFEITIRERYPKFQERIGPLFDLLMPPDEPRGSYVAIRDDILKVSSDLRRKGFRTLILDPGDLGSDVSGAFAPSDRLMLDIDGTGDHGQVDLGTLEMRLGEIFSRVKHCAVIDCAFDRMVDRFGLEDMKGLLKALDRFTIDNGGVSVHAVKDISEALSGPMMGYEEYDLASYRNGWGNEAPSKEDGTQLISAYELVTSLFLEQSRKYPLLIVVEDLQWGDTATLNLLQYLARTARTERMLILGSYRPEGFGPDEGYGEPSSKQLKEALQRISREKLFEVIEVGRLDKVGTGLLLESLMGCAPEQPLLDQVYLETEGNPHYIIERHRVAQADPAIIAETDRTLPDPGDEQVIRRVRSLDPSAREVLDLTSAMARAVRVEDLIQMTERSEEEVLDAVDTLNQMRFLRETEEGLVFDQNKVREAVQSVLPPQRRRSLHLGIAEWLAGRLDGSDPENMARLAHHYFMGERYKSAFDLYLASSERSMERSYMDQAQKELERALECIGHLDDTRENWTAHVNTVQYLGDIHQRRGELFRALNRYKEARDLSERRSMTSGLSSIYRRMGDTMLRLFDWDQTLDNYLHSLNLSKKAEDRSEVALAFRGLGRVYYLKGDYNRALECYMKYLEHPHGSRTSTYIQALQEIGDIYNEMGDFNQALTYYKLSIRTGEEKGIPKETALSYVRMSNVLLKVGDLDDARRFSDWAYSLVRDNLGDDVSEKVLIGYIEMMIEFGDLESAEDGASAIPGGLQGAGSDRLIDAVKARINALLLARRRDFEASHTEMERSTLVLQELQVPFQLALTYFQSGLIRFQCMEVERAKELLIKASEIFKALRSIHYMSRTSSKLKEVTFIMEGMRR